MFLLTVAFSDFFSKLHLGAVESTRNLVFLGAWLCSLSAWGQGSTTWDGQQWSQGLPGLESRAILSAKLQVDSTLRCRSLVLAEGTSVNVTPGSLLEVMDTLLIPNSATVTIEAGGSLWLGEAVRVFGQVSIQQQAQPITYSYLSSPIRVLRYEDVAGRDKFIYNEIFNNRNTRWAEADGFATPGLGFTALAAGNVTFTGVPNNGNISIFGSRSGNGPMAGFNLLGNPYPTAISWQTLMDLHPSLSGSVWFWADAEDGSGNGRFITVNHITDPLEEQSIATAQGFFVRAQGSGNVVFTHQMRKQTNRNTFYRQSTLEVGRVKISITADNYYKQDLWLAFSPEFSTTFDRGYDALNLKGNQAFDALWVEEDERDLSVLAWPDNRFPMQKTIGLDLLQPANIAITIDTLGHLPEGLAFFWRDNLFFTEDRLQPGDTLRFRVDKGDWRDRFQLAALADFILGEEAIETVNETPKIYYRAGQLETHFPQPVIGLVQVGVFTSDGRHLYKGEVFAPGKKMLTFPMKLANTPQLLILKTAWNSTQCTQKLYLPLR